MYVISSIFSYFFGILEHDLLVTYVKYSAAITKNDWSIYLTVIQSPDYLI